eukprot:TRINITY_DN28487_c0_g1_i1.p1 TRINITY_DN28487_c0_g1~~TRINITY_DN28487_c0_g1_i1.p1  ORF type:complete len:377 (-),score=107.06 TRINITY_DN28487_c0_g1_i1:47-1177(-)
MTRSRWGRRRPVIVVFGVMACVALVGFSLSLHVKRLLGDRAAICWAFLFFASMDFSLNGMQAPLRALLVDQAPAAQQAVANSYFCLWGASGQTVGYLFGSILPTESVFIIAAGVIMCTCTLCCMNAHEVLEPPSPASSESVCTQVVHSLHAIPAAMAKMWIVQFWSFFGLFTVMVNGVNFFAQELAGGDPDAKHGSHAKLAYDSGCHEANMAFAGMCFTGLIISFCVPRAIDRFGVQKLEVLNLLVMSGSLFSLSVARSVLSAKLLFLLLGVSWGLTTIVPWYAFSVMVGGMRNRGTVTGIFNWSQCFPEILVSVLGALLLQLTGGDIRAVLVLGGVGCAVGLLCTSMLTEPTPVLSYSQLPVEDTEAANKKPAGS